MIARICSKTLIFKKKNYTTTRQLRIHVPALAVIKLTYSRLLSSGAYRILEYFIFNNNKNNKYMCWIAGVLIEVWTPRIDPNIMHVGCGNLISLCVQLPCPSLSLLWIWKEDEEKNFTPLLYTVLTWVIFLLAS
jgi:hypothetical protein